MKRHGTLAEYMQLFLEHDKMIDSPDWYERRNELVRRMDAVWGSDPPWAIQAKEFMHKLYEQRLSR